MSAKDSTRLNRRNKAEPRVTAFRPSDYVRETITVPPHGKPHLVCQFFPECQCGDDCVTRKDERMVRRLFGLFIAGTVAIGVGLIFIGLRS